MNILGKNYEFVKVGRLEVATTNIYYPELAVCEDKGECYSNFYQVEEIDKLLKEMGCRVATREDLIYLARLGSHWVKKGERGNDIAGRFFGENAKEATMEDLKGCVFLPAACYCSDSGRLINQYSNAYYWSSTQANTYYAYYLYYSSGGLNMYADYKYLGLQVRCARDIK